MPRPKPDIDMIQIAVRVPRPLLEKVDAWAARLGASRNTAVAALLAEGVISDKEREGRFDRREAKKAAAAPPKRMTIDDVRPAFVPRLKPDKGAK